MTDSTPVRRFILDGYGGVPRTEVVFASDFDRIVAAKDAEIAELSEKYNAACIAEKEHCKDCCCARSWAALGITEYTGKSIPEHIAELRAQLAAALAKVEWQPIETAPAEGESLFYVVPREPHEQPLFERRDKGVVQTWKPYVFQGRYRTWSCLAKATHWMPLPDPPP